MKTIVIALGGNAILKKGEKPTINTQEKKELTDFIPNSFLNDGKNGQFWN